MFQHLYATALVIVVLAALLGCSVATLPIYAFDRSAFHSERAEPPSY